MLHVNICVVCVLCCRRAKTHRWKIVGKLRLFHNTLCSAMPACTLVTGIHLNTSFFHSHAAFLPIPHRETHTPGSIPKLISFPQIQTLTTFSTNFPSWRIGLFVYTLVETVDTAFLSSLISFETYLLSTEITILKCLLC